MPPEKPSRRTLLGGLLTGLLACLGFGRHPAQAAPPPLPPPVEASPTPWVGEIRTTYDAQGRFRFVEYLPSRPAHSADGPSDTYP